MRAHCSRSARPPRARSFWVPSRTSSAAPPHWRYAPISRYQKLARGDVTATARLGAEPADVVATLDAGERPEFPVHVEIARADGAVTATMTVLWTLRPH